MIGALIDIVHGRPDTVQVDKWRKIFSAIDENILIKFMDKGTIVDVLIFTSMALGPIERERRTAEILSNIDADTLKGFIDDLVEELLLLKYNKFYKPISQCVQNNAVGGQGPP